MPIPFGESFSFDQTLPNNIVPNGTLKEIHTRVLILGAGLAGLTCAYRYTQRLARPFTRADLIVLEREASVGGRVRSLKIGENVLNLGAVTFQPTAYPRYMALLNELGFQERIRIIPRRTMVLGINGHAIHAGNLALVVDGFKSLVGRGMFTPSEAMQLLRFYFYMRRVTSPPHFDELLALHDCSVAQWAEQFGFSPSVKRKFVEPFIAFTFSAPENISAAFGVLLLGFNLSHPANLMGGMMQVPEALAARLGDVIETNATALHVKRTANGFETMYRTGDQAQCIHSNAVVVTLPANIAAQIIPEMRERATTVRYGSGHAALLHGKLKSQADLHLWRADSANGAVIYGGEAQSDKRGGHYFNLLTYRGTNAQQQANAMFVDEKFEQLAEYEIRPAVAAPEPKQKPMPLDWGDNLYMAGDATGMFPSQETAVRSGEQVAEMIKL